MEVNGFEILLIDVTCIFNMLKSCNVEKFHCAN